MFMNEIVFLFVKQTLQTMFTKRLWNLILDLLFFTLISLIIVFVVFGANIGTSFEREPETKEAVHSAKTLSIPMLFKED